MTEWVCSHVIAGKEFSVHIKLETNNWSDAEKIIKGMGLGLRIDGKLLAEFDGPPCYATWMRRYV
jgi:hypothetical protein